MEDGRRDGRGREWLWPGFLWLIALAAVLVAAWLSHRWNPGAGLDPGLVVLFIALLALGLGPVRSWLGNVSKFKTPLFELGLSESTQAAATRVLTEIPDVEEGDEDGDGERLRLIGELWGKAEDAPASLALLRRRLKLRLAWSMKEAFSPSRRAAVDYPGALAELQGCGLLSRESVEVARVVLTLSEREVLGAGQADRDRLDRFLRAADRIVYQLRLNVLDRLVRDELEKLGCRLIDFEQPRRRWPDFYAYRMAGEEGPAVTLRVAVRMALREDSKLLRKSRERLRESPGETPLDDGAIRAIVVPNRSKTTLETQGEAHEIKRGELAGLLERLSVPAA